MELVLLVAACLMAGATIGFVGGVLGIGGGLLAIPLLGLVFGMEQQMAQGTSLIMVLPAILMTVRKYNQQTRIDKRVALAGAAGAVVFRLAADSIAAMNTKIARKPSPASDVISAWMNAAFRPRRSRVAVTVTAPDSGPMKAICADRSGGRSGSTCLAAASASADERPPYAVRPCSQLGGICVANPASWRAAFASRPGRVAGEGAGG